MLEARSLTKYFNHTPAVRQVSFAVHPGEILGYLGPNGAGKSTTVKMLVGLIEPSEGQIFYRGRSVHDDFTAYQRRIGYVPEEPHLYPHLSGREYLQLVGRLRGMPRRVLESKMDEFLRVFGLWSDRHAPLASYSKGMRQKILLSAALLHDPDILILDEPFSGLDVTSTLMLRSLLQALAGKGKIILYSSHVLEVVEKICSTVLILRQGEVVAYDSIQRLRELMSQPSLEGVFAQLAEVDDGEEVAGRIVEAMTWSGNDVCPAGEIQEPAPQPGMKLYRGIANAMPQEFKNMHGDELLLDAEQSRGPAWRMLLDLAIRVPVEHLTEFGRDVRYSLRTLRASPGFTLVALLSLCLGIGIATSAYSELNGFLRDIPGIPNPGQLVSVHAPVSFPTYKRYREMNDLFSGTFAYVAPVPFDVSLGGHAERLWGQLVTPSYFPTLGVRPLLGRFFDTEDDQTGRAPAVVVSHQFWKNHLGSDPSIAGKTILVNGYACMVAGIAPQGFHGASPGIFPADLWLPVSVDPSLAPELRDNALERHDITMFQAVGRLRPGITEARAKLELDAADRQLAESWGEIDRDQRTNSVGVRAKSKHVELLEAGRMMPVQKKDLPFFREFLTVLGGLVLLIACANVANMMLARAADRRKEISVRLARGASRGRLIRQLLSESLLLAAAAAPPAFLLSMWLMHLASTMKMPLPIPLTFDLAPDWHALVFTFFITALTGVAFGLVPALQATRADLVTALKEGGNVRVRKHRALNMRNVLVLCQMAASLTLLLMTGYLGLGIQSTLGVQQGFDPKNVYLIALDPVRDGYSPQRAVDFFDKLLKRVRTLPGVVSACLTDTLPVATDGNSGVRFFDSHSPGDYQAFWARKHTVGRDYFETAGIRILSGRGFQRQDEEGRGNSVVVSQETVGEVWNGGDPVGRRIEIRNWEAGGAFGVWPGTIDFRPNMLGTQVATFEVIGVARDVSEDLVASKKHPAVYFPLRWADYAQPSLRGMTLMVRSAPGVNAIHEVEREVSAMDSNITPFNSRSMIEHIDQYMSALKGASWTYGLMGFFGLALASVGIAGVTAYSVAKRGHEIGIRMALGAQKGNVLRLVMKEGAGLVISGTVIGLVMAWAGMRVLSAAFFTAASVKPSDPRLLIGAPLLLMALALLACYLPARRSTRIDPVVTLRQE